MPPTRHFVPIKEKSLYPGRSGQEGFDAQLRRQRLGECPAQVPDSDPRATAPNEGRAHPGHQDPLRPARVLSPTETPMPLAPLPEQTPACSLGALAPRLPAARLSLP